MKRRKTLKQTVVTVMVTGQRNKRPFIGPQGIFAVATFPDWTMPLWVLWSMIPLLPRLRGTFWAGLEVLAMLPVTIYLIIKYTVIDGLRGIYNGTWAGWQWLAEPAFGG